QTDADVRLRHLLQQLDSYARLVAQIAIDSRDRRIQHLPNRDGVAARFARIRHAKNFGHELRDTRCRQALALGDIALRREALHVHDRQYDDREDHRGRARYDPTIALPVLARAVSYGVGPRDDRAIVQVPIDIARESGRRRIALRDILVHRLHDDRIEIASKRLGGCRCADGILRVTLQRGGTRLPRSLFENGLFDLLERLAREIVRLAFGQE